MHPTLFQIGPFTIYSYGAALAAGVLIVSMLLQREAKKLGYHPETILDLVFWTVLSGILGGRLFYILLNVPYFLENPFEIIMLQKGGLAWQGGLIVGTIAAVMMIRKKGLPFWPTADLVAPYIALGQSIGRVGCFFNGCCYGKPWEWGIFFPVHQARIHPAQLYDSLGLVMIFVALRLWHERRHRPGQILIMYFLLSSWLRFVVEFFRADHTQIIFALSIFQIISLVIFAASAYAYLYLKSRRS